MKKRQTIVSAIIATLLCSALPSLAATASWCQKQETTIFNCQLGKQKVVSICASPKLSQQSGYMQYRFGKLSATTPELTYPNQQSHPYTHFKIGQTLYASAAASWLSFDNGEFRYVLKDTLGRDVDEQVLAVYQKSSLIAKMQCSKTSVSLNEHSDLLRKVLVADDRDETEL